jgi:hypothetical protein
MGRSNRHDGVAGNRQENSPEAIMASLIIITAITVAAGALSGAYWVICSAIRREDRVRGSLRLGATSLSARSARDLVGISRSTWR